MSKESPEGTMKCVNVRIEDDSVWFDCPHCGVDAEVDEDTLKEVWEHSGNGQVPCPPPEGCGKEYILPTLSEVAVKKLVGDTGEQSKDTEPEAAGAPETVGETRKDEVPKADAEPVISTETALLEEHAPAKVEPTPIIGQVSEKPKHKAVPTRVAAASGADQSMAIRTFRHSDWQGGGEDKFDEEVSRFLEKVGSDNVVSVTPISYTEGDTKLIDYGVMVVFKTEATTGEEPAEKKKAEVIWRD